MRTVATFAGLGISLAVRTAEAQELPPLPPPPPPATAPAPAPAPATATAPAPAPAAYRRTTSGESVPPTKIGEGKKRAWWDCLPQDSDSEIPRLSTGCSGVFGIRVPITGMDKAGTGVWVGFGIQSEGEEYIRRGFFSFRGTHRMGLAGGGAGFEGTLDGSLAFGARIPFGERHGPVARIGIAGHVMGNDLFYSSMIEAPQGQLGYQYMRGITVFEAGATLGFAIDGRYGQRYLSVPPTSPHRPLGEGLEYGGYLAMQMPHFRMGIQAQRFPTRDGKSGDLYVSQGTVCGMGVFVALCADIRVMSESGMGPFGSPVNATYYGGITIGFSRER